ncbi:hypothetical protein TVAG_120490 [Trichomonas vaginalis G3]|uniref:Uncharacterized protein n=1 Tax=Trichomonas vaginalis (strain ATCC PRA-98 / G3) TaxID=412133 RepID=A2D7J4_TRIV3|nr:hypothetical protein TVAGG3_0993540 [Trichomonas vaginalis G3]EAY23711.1 hypothetical protein TVAG_120490 [Trichomonas vaginalis G3]KAI5490206.1 hypothetical protein TVAGG3_0993540 [Trichomonas vaginalis G3]|eukprot:XP_001276959.1 hypothetical protein [Trichomonas vaginalis G3]
MSGRKALAQIAKNQNQTQVFQKHTRREGCFSTKQKNKQETNDDSLIAELESEINQQEDMQEAAKQWDEKYYQIKLEQNINELNNRFQAAINEYNTLQNDIAILSVLNEQYSHYCSQLAELYNYAKKQTEETKDDNFQQNIENMVNQFNIPDEDKLPDVEYQIRNFDNPCDANNMSEFIEEFRNLNKEIQNLQEQRKSDTIKLEDTKDSIEKLHLLINLSFQDLGLISNE